MKLEYTAVEWSYEHHVQPYLYFLNEKGSEGWELVCIVKNLHVFKREIPQPAEQAGPRLFRRRVQIKRGSVIPVFLEACHCGEYSGNTGEICGVCGGAIPGVDE